MRMILLFICSTNLSYAEVDLGNLVIEGEVRRPMMRKIESFQMTKDLVEKRVVERLKELEREILSRNLGLVDNNPDKEDK